MKYLFGFISAIFLLISCDSPHKISVSDVEWHRNYQNNINNDNEIVEVYSRILEENKNNVNAYYLLGRAYSFLEDHYKQESVLKEGYKLDSNNFYLNLGLGAVNQTKGFPNNSIKYYLKAGELQPNHISPWNNLILIYIDKFKETNNPHILAVYSKKASNYLVKYKRCKGVDMSFYKEALNEVNQVRDNANQKLNRLTSCAVCGNKFKGYGYTEKSHGNWVENSYPHQSYICSESCGASKTKNWEDLLNKTNRNSSSRPFVQCSYCNGRKFIVNQKCPACKGTGRYYY